MGIIVRGDDVVHVNQHFYKMPSIKGPVLVLAVFIWATLFWG